MKRVRLVLREVSAPRSPMVDPFVGVYGATIVSPRGSRPPGIRIDGDLFVAAVNGRADVDPKVVEALEAELLPEARRYQALKHT